MAGRNHKRIKLQHIQSIARNILQKQHQYSIKWDLGEFLMEIFKTKNSFIFLYFHRLLLLMAMGLGAMYMLHLLAQDWNKIRRPIPPAVTRILTGASTQLDRYITRGRRDTNGHHFSAAIPVRNNKRQRLRSRSNVRKRNATATTSAAASLAASLNTNTINIDWKRILSRDPFECLQSLICQLLSGAEKNSNEAAMLCDFLEQNVSMAPAKIGRAFGRGLALRGQTERCYDEYPFCWYSAKTMLKMLKWFADTVHSDES